MIEFHNTGTGREFFGHTLPQLISAIHNLSDAVNRISKQARTPLDATLLDVKKELEGAGVYTQPIDDFLSYITRAPLVRQLLEEKGFL